MDRKLKLDILAIGAHPDDVELGAAGILLKQISIGATVGILDLTQGELGTRGSASIRRAEAFEAEKLLGLSVRENLAFKDGWFQNDQKHQEALIKQLRKYQPEIVITNAPKDRHPDHPKACKISLDSCFLSGLEKIQTHWNGVAQTPWRPKKIFHYIQYQPLTPSFIIDTSDFQEQKMKVLSTYKSQFYNPKYSKEEKQTMISSQYFIASVVHRAMEMGQRIGTKFGEGLICAANQTIEVKNLLDC